MCVDRSEQLFFRSRNLRDATLSQSKGEEFRIEHNAIKKRGGELSPDGFWGTSFLVFFAINVTQSNKILPLLGRPLEVKFNFQKSVCRLR